MSVDELIEFIPHGNSQVRSIVVENLMGYALENICSFKKHQLLPVKNLMLLARDYEQIAKNALTILINLSTDCEIREFLVSDREFLGLLIRKLVNPSEPCVDEISSLLSNLSKQDELKTLLLSEEPTLAKKSETFGKVIDQLLDIFTKNTSKSRIPNSCYDHLSYIFADIATNLEGREHMLTKQVYDEVIPLTKLIVFTSHYSIVRRRGVAATIKNVCFETAHHTRMLKGSEDGIGILPYLLLPLMGSEEYDEEDIEHLPEECQFLPADKQRESDHEITKMHLESLLLLTTTRPCRDQLRDAKIYSIIRELHLAVEDEGVREVCDRLVQILMRDEEDSDLVLKSNSLAANPEIVS